MATDKQLKALAKARRARAKKLQAAKKTAKSATKKARTATKKARTATKKARTATKKARAARDRVLWLIAATDENGKSVQYYDGDDFTTRKDNAALYSKKTMQKIAANLSKRLNGEFGLAGESCAVK